MEDDAQEAQETEQAPWRESPDLLASMDKLDAIELGDEDLIDTGEPYQEGYGSDATYTPMFQRPFAKWIAVIVAVSMVGGVAYVGIRIILDWLGG